MQAFWLVRCATDNPGSAVKLMLRGRYRVQTDRLALIMINVHLLSYRRPWMSLSTVSAFSGGVCSANT